MGYNADLYENYSTASSSPHGLAGVSVMIQTGQLSNLELRRITDAAMNIKYGGQILKAFYIANSRLYI
jgi:hypothetical protein